MNTIYPWLSEAWQGWQRQLAAQTFSNATLINAPEGMGAEQLVETFSHALMCTTNHSEPCGFCHGCDLIQSATHPDLHWIRPEKQGKAITVEQVRAVNRLAQESSQLSGFRLIIITPAEAMNESAANALLKTLEEPAEKCIFVLLTHQINQLLPTIISRCQQLTIPEAPPSLVVDWLAHECQEKVPSFAVHLNGNAPLLTRQFIVDGQLKEYQKLEQLFIASLQGDIHASLACAKLISSDALPRLRWLWYVLTDAQKVVFKLEREYFTPGSDTVAQTVSLLLLQQQTESLVNLINQLQQFSGLNSELLITDWLFLFNEETCS